MKNMDPKIMTGVMIAIIVLCVIVVVRTMGFGSKVTPPPIMSGGPSGAAMTLPNPPPSANPVGATAAGGPGTPMVPGGSMTLPVPPTSH